MIPVFFNKGDSLYYYEGEILNCNLCHKDLVGHFFLNTSHNRKFNQIEQQPYCLKCGTKIKRRLDGAFTTVCIEKVPSKAIPVLPQGFIDRYRQPANVAGVCITTHKEIEQDIRRGVNIDLTKAQLALSTSSIEGAKIGKSKTPLLENNSKDQGGEES